MGSVQWALQPLLFISAGAIGIAVDNEGRCFVTDSVNHHVLLFSPGVANGEVIGGSTFIT
jgi:hypothetical protein